ncbi:hypothetical protein ACHWQZ_G003783 [Mnemiopsis leidyi]
MTEPGPKLSTQELESLSEEERNSLLAVLARAKEFEKAEEEESHRPIEGQLLKWTNVVKGWQQRWFFLSPDVGLLHYFLSEDKKLMGPRGSLRLIGAAVQPSGEDQLMFSIVPQQGDPYKLKASTAKDKQVWIDRIRRVIERHTSDVNTLVKAAAATMPGQQHNQEGGVTIARSQSSAFRKSKRPRPASAMAAVGTTGTNTTNGNNTSQQLVDMNKVLHSLNTAHRNQLLLNQFIEDSDKFADPAVLRYKAASQALFKQLDECYSIINHLKVGDGERDRISSFASVTSGENSNHDPVRSSSTGQKTTDSEEATFSDTYNHISSSINHDLADDDNTDRQFENVDDVLAENMNNSGESRNTATTGQESGPKPPLARSGSVISCSNVTFNWDKVVITPEQSVQYDEAYEDGDEDNTDIGEHKSVIMSLLGQLKLGMDLTKVVLPTFILERKSLLELFANCFSHPDIFMSISDGQSPEERILRATKWLLTSFHAGRKGSLAKKPYNPIIGEVFHCKWAVDSPTNPSSSCIAPGQKGHVTFLAEQVSHHPPVSAFYAECPDKKICANYSVWTKSKFLGISVGVDMVGIGTIHLLEHGEKYHFTLPSTYGRSILTVPWSEMGGKVQVTCPQTDYTSTLVFHTKPMYGGKMHRVTGDIKDNMTGKCLYKIDGEWNGKLKFTDESNKSSEVINTEVLSVVPKLVKPVCEQKENESRRLWRDVTLALRNNDIDKATAAKTANEERQRSEGKARAAEDIAWVPSYFELEGESWIYKKSLAEPK